MSQDVHWRRDSDAMLAVDIDDSDENSTPPPPAPLQPREAPSELLETVKRKMPLAAGERSPRAYQKIAVADERLSSFDSIGSMSSIASKSRERKFACQFDPSVKNGRALVLTFDKDGIGTFQEMTRLDLLRRTQDAARSSARLFEAGVPVSDVSAAAAAAAGRDERGGTTARRLKGNRKASQRRLHADPADMAAQYGTICDVQRVHARDIRKLDNAFAVSNEPSFIIRKQAILVNADPLRAIIMRDACLVFVPDGADSLLSILKDKFLETTQHESNDDVPYEFKALEALLSTLCRCFEADYEKNAPVITAALDRLAHGKIAASELETLRTFKNTMNEFESQVDGVRRALMEILDNEEDLRLLYLTKLYEDPSLLSDLWSFDSEEAEVLIENYLQDIFSTRTKASLMQHRIQNTESLVMLKLDSMRNYLLGVDILFSIVAISLSVGTFIAGIFGMNLNSDLQEKPGWFWGVTYFSIGIMFVIGLTSYVFFRRKGVFI